MTAQASPEVVIAGRIRQASNATFLATIGDLSVVYKPIAGEKPLWDFPGVTLAHREVAAFLVSDATGWGLVPPTWLGEGPYGPGMVQEWRDVDPAQHAVDIVPAGRARAGSCAIFDGEDGRGRAVTLVHEDTEPLRRMAVFDAVVNNADRKGGHVLEMPDGHRYGVDHGLTFHVEPKLRTVLWGWAGQPLQPAEIEVLTRLREQLSTDLGERLSPYLGGAEMDALDWRIEDLLRTGTMPMPGGEWHVIPWPPL